MRTGRTAMPLFAALCALAHYPTSAQPAPAPAPAPDAAQCAAAEQAYLSDPTPEHFRLVCGDKAAVGERQCKEAVAAFAREPSPANFARLCNEVGAGAVGGMELSQEGFE